MALKSQTLKPTISGTQDSRFSMADLTTWFGSTCCFGLLKAKAIVGLGLRGHGDFHVSFLQNSTFSGPFSFEI